MSAKSWMKDSYYHGRGPFGICNNMYRRPWPKRLCEDGTVIFEDGSDVKDVDVVMFCTGPCLCSDSNLKDCELCAAIAVQAAVTFLSRLRFAMRSYVRNAFMFERLCAVQGTTTQRDS